MPSYLKLFKIIFNIILLRIYIPRGLLRFHLKNSVYFSLLPHVCLMLSLYLINLITFDEN